MNSENLIFDKKLIVLFILKEAKAELSVDQIAKLCLEFEDITYFDVCSFLQTLKNNNHVKEIYLDNKCYYTLTCAGNDILEELIELVPGINLLNMKKLLKLHVEDYKPSFEIDTIVIPIKSDEYKVSCFIKDGPDELVNITMYAGQMQNAKKISEHWKENAEEIYTKIIDLMTE